LACQSNVAIVSCSWTPRHGGIQLSSEPSPWGKDNDLVAIGRSEGSPVDDMCYLLIESVNDSHYGMWDCTVHEPDKEKCGSNDPSQRVVLEVLERGEFGGTGAQYEYYGLIGSEVLLTVRANERINKCTISKNEVDILEIDGDAREDVCVFPDMSGSSDVRVCGEITKEYPSCILKIDSVTAAFGGEWIFSLENIKIHWSKRNYWFAILQLSNQSYESPVVRTHRVGVDLVVYEANDVFGCQSILQSFQKSKLN